MWALIARVLGPLVVRYIEREALELLLKEFGMKFLRGFVQKVGVQALKNMTKDEILAAARAAFQEQSGKLFSDKLFKISRAKQFGRIINEKIDDIATVGGRWVRRRVIATEADNLGIPMTGKIAGQGAKTRLGKLFTDKVLGPLFLPHTRLSAFSGGFLRGSAGETVSVGVNRIIDVLIGLPRGALNTPRYRAFIRAAYAEVKHLQSIGELKDARRLWNALKIAGHAAEDAIPGVPRHLAKYRIAGQVSGRVATGAYIYYGPHVDDDERDRRAERFKKSLVPFAKQETRKWVAGYTRADGTRVKGHYVKRPTPSRTLMPIG